LVRVAVADIGGWQGLGVGAVAADMADSSFVLLFCWLWTQYHTISRVCMVTTFLEFYSRVVPRPPYRQNLRPPGLAIIILKRIKHNKVPVKNYKRAQICQL
jgi:hypothetical protein